MGRNYEKQYDKREGNYEKGKREVCMSFLGVVLGALIGFGGTYYTSQKQEDIVEKQYIQEIELRNREKKEEIYTEMLQSIYGLKKMQEGLVEDDLLDFREECYTIMAKARIFCDIDTIILYEKFLDDFFGNKIYDGKYVDGKLIVAIREELNVE